jgi:putative restriction endonuclease
MQPFIANTDKAWFDFLAGRASGGVVDEVNFWSPQSTQPLRGFEPGEIVFFRLKRPHSAIAGYGFFAVFRVLGLDLAWDLFGWKNGDPDKVHFLRRIGDYRGIDLLSPAAERAPLGCTVLRTAVFWPEERWIPWGAEMGWARNVVRGSTERDPKRIEDLLFAVGADAPQELEASPFELAEIDERLRVVAETVVREGQGAFRARLLDAYDGRCAVTGEHTELVLDAAHIQPYLGPRSNHVQNGLLLTKEFHALFDGGYVTVTPDYVVRVSSALKREWSNGRRYYPFDGKRLTAVPREPRLRPSQEALAWHGSNVFRNTG